MMLIIKVLSKYEHYNNIGKMMYTIYLLDSGKCYLTDQGSASFSVVSKVSQ